MAVYCVGDIRTDIALTLEDHRLAGSRVSLGGTVANFSVVGSKLGQRVSLLGTVADDAHGRFLLSELGKYGIDTSAVTVTPNGMNSILMVLDGSELLGYSIMSVPETRYDTLGSIDFGRARPGRGDLVHTSSGFIENYPQENKKLILFLEQAKEAGAKISFDLNLRTNEFGDAEERMNDIRRIAFLSDILFGSYSEFEALTGAPVDDAVSLFGKDRIVIARNEVQPVKYGCFGSYGEVPVTPVPVINPNGAGDSFDAAFLYARSRTDDIEKGIRFAGWVAGYMISHREARAVPPPEELDAYFE